MALPMDEQRILEEMERMLAADDPRLAARLAAFGQPGLGQVLRTRRARATLSLMALVIIAAVASVIYMMSAFRLSATSVRSGQQATTHSSQQVTHHLPSTVVPPADPARCAATWAPDCGGWSFFSSAPPAFRPSTPASRTASSPATSTASSPASSPASRTASAPVSR